VDAVLRGAGVAVRVDLARAVVGAPVVELGVLEVAVRRIVDGRRGDAIGRGVGRDVRGRVDGDRRNRDRRGDARGLAATSAASTRTRRMIDRDARRRA